MNGFHEIFLLAAVFFVLPLTSLTSVQSLSLLLAGIVVFVVRWGLAAMLAVASFFPLFNLNLLFEDFTPATLSDRISVGVFLLGLFFLIQVVISLRNGTIWKQRLSLLPVVCWFGAITLMLFVTFYQSNYQSIDSFSYSLKFWLLSAVGFAGGFLGAMNGRADFLRRFLHAFVSTAISVVVLYTALHVVNPWWAFSESAQIDWRLMGYPFGNPATTALVLMISLTIPFFLQSTSRTLSFALYFAGVLGILQAGSRTVALTTLLFMVLFTAGRLWLPVKVGIFWLGAVFGCLFYLLLTNLIRPDILVGLSRRPGLFDDPMLAGPGSGLVTNSRIEFWTRYFEIFLENPILGVGVVAIGLGFTPHSLPLELLAGLGLIGALIAISLPSYTIFLVLRNSSANFSAYSLFAIFVVGLYVSVNQSLTTTFPILWFFWGALHAHLLNQQETFRIKRGPIGFSRNSRLVV